MIAPKHKPVVRLTGQDDNAFFILGAVKNALKSTEADKEYIDQYTKEAMSGDYDHLLAVTMEYVDVI